MDTVSFKFKIITNFLIFLFEISTAADTIYSSQSVGDNGTTLVSKGGSFELGFFSPGGSKNRYLGIWYKNIPDRTVVWVANRRNPINDSTGLLMMNSAGHVELLGQDNTVVWWADSKKIPQRPVLQLLDSGNLVLREETDGNSGIYAWQSFDYPTDTYLPEMKFGWDLKTGLNRFLSAWKNSDDPSPGDFTWSVELNAYPESYLRKGSQKYLRLGPWNGLRTSGFPDNSSRFFDSSFMSNEEEVYFTLNYNLQGKSVISRTVMNQTNYLAQFYIWDQDNQNWRLHVSLPSDFCDFYGQCGANSICILTCQCLEGFKPKSQENWTLLDFSQGCVREEPLNCQGKDRFIKTVGLKLPDTTYTWVNKSMNREECKVKCSQNCSCTAYANMDIRARGSGCALWFGDLIDIRQFPASGQDLYIRVFDSQLDTKKGRQLKVSVIVATVAAIVLGVLLVACYICRRKKNKKGNSRGIHQSHDDQKEDLELTLFDLAEVTSASDNFSLYNKLGEGGFGPVYRGTLADGREIAVKRLSRSSGQGMDEFKNEVILIAKLQHRNLVKLLGYCTQGEEKMLIYEYMPNRSLDSFIFDQTKVKLLDWSKRFHIICGIARGLLYLHQDSRLRIIHRDLKASNVLLDNELNPKISDFGLARLFGGDQTEASTKRVVGTYGYMAPEYANHGLFSVKSDVFSFGILLLEIVSGKKSRGFYHPSHSVSLIGQAYILWKEGRALDLVDESLRKSCIPSEVLRCIHLSLLCVQQSRQNRPNMSSVLVMLGSENALMPQPKQPAFFIDETPFEAACSSSYKSINEVTITLMEAR